MINSPQMMMQSPQPGQQMTKPANQQFPPQMPRHQQQMPGFNGQPMQGQFAGAPQQMPPSMSGPNLTSPSQSGQGMPPPAMNGQHYPNIPQPSSNPGMHQQQPQMTGHPGMHPTMQGPPSSMSGPPMPGQNLSGPPMSMQGQNMSNSGPPGLPPPQQSQFSGMNGPSPNQPSMPPKMGQPPMQQAQQMQNSGQLPMPPMSMSGPGQQQLSSPSQPPMSAMSGPGQQQLSSPNQPPMSMSGPSQSPMSGLASPNQSMMLGASPNQQMPPMNRANMGQPPMPGQMASPYNNNQYPPSMQQPAAPGNYPGNMSGRSFNQPSYSQPPHPGMSPQYPTSPMGSAQPQRRLDPDQMPNPIQVMSDNQHSNGGNFITNQPGLLPPLVTTKFVTHDQGNTNPRLLRSSMYSVPANSDMMKQSAVPFSLVISPFARLAQQEMQPPIVDMGEVGPIRCVRCKAYMSPYMQFIDAGRRFQCLLCKAVTEVPAEYFQHLDHTGQRADKYERPELVLGTYEFMATKDYCRNNVPPKPPAMIFIIDVSYNNVKSGLVSLLCQEMKEIIKHLPVDAGQQKTAMRVGFITYNNVVHFYNLKSTLAQPQMMVVGDVHEMFMPLLDGFLVDPEESSVLIDLLMEQIPKMFGETRETETILLPAIQAGCAALKASECVGKLLLFHSSLPNAEAPGKLKHRDDRKLLGTEKEKTVLTPQNNVYNEMGQECALNGCSVDLFIFNNAYIDLATIGQVSRLSGGEVYKYTYFQANIDGERLVQDVIKDISRPIAFDSVMRVRTSTGIRPTDFYGHFFMSNTTDMEIASIDCDKSIAIEIKHDDKLPPEENVYIQVALLYTSCSGQRRLRIMNLCLKTCTQLADLFRSCDLDTIILYFAKQGIFKLLEHTPKVFRDNLINRTAQILACYRKNCASPTSASQLILPECLKLLPLYIGCLLKNDAFFGGSDITLDDRSFAMYHVCTMDLPTSVVYFYPRLIPIHNVSLDDADEIPPPTRCTIEKISDSGAYILENGIYMFIWLGIGLPNEFTQSVFGAQTTQLIDTERGGLPVFDNALSKVVRGIVDRIQNERHRCMRIALVKQRDKLETVFRHFLIEDRGVNGTESYVDFLCHMHKEIRELLS